MIVRMMTVMKTTMMKTTMMKTTTTMMMKTPTMMTLTRVTTKVRKIQDSCKEAMQLWGYARSLSLHHSNTNMYSFKFSHRLFQNAVTNSNFFEFSFTDSFFLHNIIFQSWRGFQIKNFQPGDWSETIMIHRKPWWQKWNQSETIMIYCKLWWKNAINLKQLRRKGEKWCWEEESYIQQLVFLSEEENL